MVFPADMDLEMRMELLEALEAVFHEDVSTVNQLVDSDREFDENDYEMLLALDENNHEHLGASAAQIANLPESTVHNDSFEACSICLETPFVGDTIRHLPCLHKFHKGCIDPWLSRKRSCPICKSDI
uniref:RING-type domain-containing protein n=1 Tax=Opuntia streptacantha TaxID=393608 RepID=A0A7C9A5J2_OPUST